MSLPVLIPENSYSLPVRVRWDGWESDTYRLKREGWVIHASDRLSQYSHSKIIELLLKDPSDKILLHGGLEVPMRELYHHTATPRLAMDYARYYTERGVDLKLYRFTEKIFVETFTNQSWVAMMSAMPIDGLALDARYLKEEVSPRDLPIFRYKETAKEIYIPERSVDDCLNRILELQYPEQQLIKSRKLEVGQAAPLIQAKIYTLAD